MTRDNYIVIQGWMITELNLSGNELLIYAIIYGFSQDENQTFRGSLKYLSDWTNSTKRGTIKSLKSLLDKGLVCKKDVYINKVKFCEYGIVRKFTSGELSSSGGSELSSPNNININNINKENNNIINNIITKESENEAKRETKHRYGEYKNVLLTDTELEKLKAEYPSDYKDRIERLSCYIESTGKTYKNHLATIRNWDRMDKDRKKATEKPKRNYDMSIDEVYGIVGDEDE